jgi:hypothetical protein
MSASGNTGDGSEFPAVSCSLNRAADCHVGHLEFFANRAVRFTRLYLGKDVRLLIWGKIGWFVRTIAWPTSRTRWLTYRWGFRLS